MFAKTKVRSVSDRPSIDKMKVRIGGDWLSERPGNPPSLDSAFPRSCKPARVGKGQCGSPCMDGSCSKAVVAVPKMGFLNDLLRSNLLKKSSHAFSIQIDSKMPSAVRIHPVSACSRDLIEYGTNRIVRSGSVLYASWPKMGKNTAESQLTQSWMVGNSSPCILSMVVILIHSSWSRHGRQRTSAGEGSRCQVCIGS